MLKGRVKEYVLKDLEKFERMWNWAWREAVKIWDKPIVDPNAPPDSAVYDPEAPHAIYRDPETLPYAIYSWLSLCNYGDHIGYGLRHDIGPCTSRMWTVRQQVKADTIRFICSVVCGIWES